ncbi:hypothetical protein GCM10007320_04300 [Pseudorhodoferax aquiterrae]|uniref:Uncharacterized protein n=1 Tax=Pseudorhodoferax aquiterrae TaxID=747304 RepID=A0ABQ3FVB2_9BURK|nr:hypothetical protein GCM10007320_04300 [Pseudorhodoferax aquiterrae]
MWKLPLAYGNAVVAKILRGADIWEGRFQGRAVALRAGRRARDGYFRSGQRRAPGSLHFAPPKE